MISLGDIDPNRDSAFNAAATRTPPTMTIVVQDATPLMPVSGTSPRCGGATYSIPAALQITSATSIDPLDLLDDVDVMSSRSSAAASGAANTPTSLASGATALSSGKQSIMQLLLEARRDDETLAVAAQSSSLIARGGSPTNVTALQLLGNGDTAALPPVGSDEIELPLDAETDARNSLLCISGGARNADRR